MKGVTSTYSVVKLRLLCAVHDVDLGVVWQPRSDPHQHIADTCCKVQEKSDGSLHQAVYAQPVLEPVLVGRDSALHVFASSADSKVEGVSSLQVPLPRVP